MSDLLSACNGAIPIRFLKGNSIHNRVNKLVIQKATTPVIVKGGDSIKIEKIEDEPVVKVDSPAKEKEKIHTKKVVDTPALEVLKIEDKKEVTNDQEEKPKVLKKQKQKRKQFGRK